MKKFTPMFLLTCFIVVAGLTPKAQAQDAYLGEIRLFAGNFAPNGWMKCEGQLLPIATNQALYAILGTTYGGNGQTTFALPDLRGRLPMGQGSGPGLTPTVIGEQQGSENTTLLINNLPAHNHTMQVYNGSGSLDSLTTSTAYLSLIQNPDLSRSNAFTTNAPNATLNTGTLSTTGIGTPFSRKQPTTTITYIIAVQGIFPTQ
jgi:microcystin-dependent protein